MLSCSNCNIKNSYETQIGEASTYKNSFNSILNDLIEFFRDEKNMKSYKDKNKMDNKKLYFKYKKDRKNKKCWIC
jgi:hypothetical protein